VNTYELRHHGILGQKWGVRRYKNADGTLTNAGKARYDKDVQRNNQKKKKDRADEDALRDPSRWVKEDLTRTKNAVDSTARMARTVKEIRNNAQSKKTYDLSKMSDNELRQHINRMQMEEQYTRLMNDRAQEVKSGRDYVDSVLSVSGQVLTVASSAVGLAFAIHQLKNG
jgi:hypothetical protein